MIGNIRMMGIFLILSVGVKKYIYYRGYAGAMGVAASTCALLTERKSAPLRERDL